MSPEARPSAAAKTATASSGGAKGATAAGAAKGAAPSKVKKISDSVPRPPAGKAGPRPSTKGLVRPAPRAKVRRARLVVSRVDTWSVLKLAFLLSVALGIITVVSSVLLWIIMDITGLFGGINELASMLAGPAGSTEVQDVISLGQVAIIATVLSVLNVILLTLLSVLAAMLYNLAAGLIGGIGLTLTDE